MYEDGRIDKSRRTDNAALVEIGGRNGAGCAGMYGGKQTPLTDNGFHHHPSAGRKRGCRT